MRKFVSSYIKGLTTASVLPAGTIVTDDTTGQIYVHNGTTPGGISSVQASSLFSAAAVTAATKTAISASVTVATTVGSGTSVQLVSPTLNKEYKIVNRGANALLVYPPSGGQFESAGIDNPVTIAVNGLATFVMMSATQGYAY